MIGMTKAYPGHSYIYVWDLDPKLPPLAVVAADLVGAREALRQYEPPLEEAERQRPLEEEPQLVFRIQREVPAEVFEGCARQYSPHIEGSQFNA